MRSPVRSTAPFAILWLASALPHGSRSAFAVPTQETAYQNDSLGIYVYKDGRDPRTFWYRPIPTLFQENGKTKLISRTLGDGRIEFTFHVVPRFPRAYLELVRGNIPTITSLSQLKPVQITQFGVMVDRYQVKALSEPVTHLQYLDQMFPVSIPLDAGQREDFLQFYDSFPGVRADAILYYKAEGVTAELTVQVSCKEVFQALDINNTGKWKFTAAEIGSATQDYSVNTNVRIRSKGNLTNEAAMNVISRCFLRAPAGDAAPAPAWGGGGTGAVCADGFPPPCPAGSPSTPMSHEWGAPGAPPAPQALGNPGLQFVFRRDLSNNDVRFNFSHDQVADRDDSEKVPLYLREHPESKGEGLRATPLPDHAFVLDRRATERKPFRTGLMIRSGDQHTIDMTFSFARKVWSLETMLLDALRPLVWQQDWEAPHDSVKFRVGNSAWSPASRRFVIDEEFAFEGELQLRVDIDHLVAKIPADKRRTIFSRYGRAQLYPEFRLRTHGMHFSGLRVPE